MTYSGNINEINQIIVSDPSYEKGVWCRYENDNLNAKDWNIKIEVKDYNENIDGYDITGLDFQILLSHPSVRCDFTENGIRYPKSSEIKEYTIGADTACVSFGINDIADKIRSEVDEWQPSTCLKTLADGEFGVVYEGTRANSDKVHFIAIAGFFDKDTGYSEEGLVKYFEKNFTVENLSPVMSESEELTLGGM